MMFGWIILLVILFYLWNNKDSINNCHQDHKSQKDSAQEILNIRFASGEISFEEYSERKRILNQ